MSNPMIGFGGHLGLADESSWGTAVTPSTHWVPFVSSTLGQSRTVQRVDDLGFFVPTSTFHLGRDVVELGIDVGGDVVVIPRYGTTWFGLLLEHVFGAVSTTGAGPWAHEFTLDWDAPVGLTGQQVRGQHASLPRAEVFDGLLINTFEVSADARGTIKCSFGMIGRASGGPTSISGTASFAADDEVLAHHFAALAWNSVDYTCRSWSIKLDKKLGRRPYVSSQYTDRPAPTAPADITITAQVEEYEDSLYDAYIAGTSSDMNLNATGAGNNAWANKLDNCRITGLTRPVNTAGVNVYGVTWMASADVASRGWVSTLTNDNSSHS